MYDEIAGYFGLPLSDTLHDHNLNMAKMVRSPCGSRGYVSFVPWVHVVFAVEHNCSMFTIGGESTLNKSGRPKVNACIACIIAWACFPYEGYTSNNSCKDNVIVKKGPNTKHPYLKSKVYNIAKVVLG
ncbi:hypothetical protein SCA6_016579 [Theobroma cacao]